MTTSSRNVALALLALLPVAAGAQEQLIHVPLAYKAPADGQPRPNFLPKGTQITLTPAAASLKLPAGAKRPASTGQMEVGTDRKAWIPVLITATPEHPADLCLLFIDRNRNGDFTDDGAGLPATPTQNVKTRAWWSSVNKVEVTVPYAGAATENYFVNFWAVREDSAAVPDILRYSVGSWRSGSVTVNGVPALVAAMDGDNNAVFGDGDDSWSVLQASAPKAESMVLTSKEARPLKRFMFLPTAKDSTKEMVLEFRKMAPDGSSIDFAVVPRDMTKANDRAPDDQLKDERNRPRATAPFTFGPELTAGLARARAEGKKVFVDFATTWCGPCKEMDDWIWTDKEVAAALNAGFVGVKLDGDIEKALVKRYEVAGYPHMLVLDADGKVLQRVVGYQSSTQMLAVFAKP